MPSHRHYCLEGDDEYGYASSRQLVDRLVAPISSTASQHHVGPCMGSLLILCIIRYEAPQPDLAFLDFPPLNSLSIVSMHRPCLGITYEDLAWNSAACTSKEEVLNTLLLSPEIQ